MKIPDSISAIVGPIRAIRRDIHAHPELKFEENRTAEIVASALRSFGIDEIHTGLGKTGVVGILQGPPGSKMLGLRADMDALPMTELNAFEHRSQYAGKMHACGHDGHTATLLAAAKVMSADRDFAGSVAFIFQPAEEGGGGARAMIVDGLFERFPCDAVFAIHNWPGLRVGEFGLNSGAMMASSNEFEITVCGKGAHAAMPHLGVDPVLIASHLIQAFQSLVSRETKPIDATVVSVTQINAGEATNVIPDTCVMKGTVRTFSAQALDTIEQGMARICHQLPPAFNARAEFSFLRNYPPTINHAKEAMLAADVAAEIVGEAMVQRHVEPTMGAEDFAYMLQEKPGAYIFLGNGDTNGTHRSAGHGLGPCTLHNPSYDFNDDLIPIGATFWQLLAKRFLV
ncbi:AbgB Metal-dependent amidase/aminoacylase/carboxypeptidase [Burkholderiales bacterium]|jgi:hippurate hydrolase